MADNLSIDNSIIFKWHEDLLKNRKLLDYICKKRGITVDTIKQFSIGFDHKSRRYTIPIKDALNAFVNVRKYSPTADPKMLPYATGYGENRLFPIHHVKDLKKKNIIICEGEWDCIILNQNGFPAVTATVPGAFNEKWAGYFEKRNVILIFDCDQAGRDHAQRITDKLMPYCSSIKVIDLGLEDKEDVTDFFLKYEKKKSDLVKLIKDAEEEDVYQMIELADSMQPEYFDYKIKWHGIVCGKDMSPYLLPFRCEGTCGIPPDKREGKACEICALSAMDKVVVTYTYDEYKDSLVKMVGASDQQVKGTIRADMGIPPSTKCRSCRIDIVKRQVIEDISVIPEVDFEKVDSKEYVTRRCFVWGNGVSTNTAYLFKGTTWADPHNQQGLQLVTDKKNIMDNISKFVLDTEVKDKIKIFQPASQEKTSEIWKKLNDIYRDLEANVTGIYGRKNIIMATDLVYHSLLNFSFQGKLMGKGWLECCVVGDTRTGKTQTIKNIMKHYRAGEFMTSGENTTRAGLLGGAQQANNRWTLTWGKIPLNDRKLLCIDEADNLRESGIISLLSGVRSSGIAEITMVQSQRTTARTRLLWIVNPIHGRMLDHNYGVEAIAEIFEKQQDISRIDFAIAVSKEEIPKERINKKSKSQKKVPHKYLQDLCHARIMWAWNRSAEDVVWMKGAEDLIIDYANELGEKYSPVIPLIIDAEMRIKLARMAVSMAVMMYSTDETCEKVMVYPAHVKVIKDFLEKMYDNKIMAYGDYSRQQKNAATLGNQELLDKTITDKAMVELLLGYNTLQAGDIEHIFKCEGRNETRDMIRDLIYAKALVKKTWYYKKTSSFIAYLKNRKEQLDRLADQDPEEEREIPF